MLTRVCDWQLVKVTNSCLRTDRKHPSNSSQTCLGHQGGHRGGHLKLLSMRKRRTRCVLSGPGDGSAATPSTSSFGRIAHRPTILGSRLRTFKAQSNLLINLRRSGKRTMTPPKLRPPKTANVVVKMRNNLKLKHKRDQTARLIKLKT